MNLSIPPKERSNSVKRKASGDIDTNSVQTKKFNSQQRPILEPQKLDSMERKLEKMKQISKGLNEDAAKVKLDPILEKIIRSICEFCDVSTNLHEEMVTSCNVNTEVPVSSHLQLTQPDAVSIPDQDPDVFVSYSSAAAKKPVDRRPPVDPQPRKAQKDPKILAFQDAVKHSERSTLVFNLDLGSKKTLNEKTILSQATLALSAAAAAVEGNAGKVPTSESVAALDDIMSVTQNVILYGKVTKPFENKANPNDERNKTFFTMPIRYEFKDTQTRIEAETILRDTCKVDCATPYPIILRQCIREVIDHFRNDYPDDYIKVTVDSHNLALRVSRKVKGDGWYTHKEPIPLPPQVLDIRARFVPQGFKMTNLPERRRSSRNSRNSLTAEDMSSDAPEI
jgi:hypothetical protein